MHRRFCELLPKEMLWIEHPQTGVSLRLFRGVCGNTMCGSDAMCP
jgi:hypothetical protein